MSGADIVVRAIWGLAAAWAVCLWVDTRVLQRRARELVDASDVDTLREQLNTHLAGKPTEPGDTAFEEFCDSRGVAAAGPIGQHLAAIWHAGWNNTKLDVPALLALSTQRLLRTTAFLQTIVGLFLVLGLFGTLWGIRDVLPFLDNFIGANNQGQRSVLSDLVGSLRAAFYPSLWGVGVTVVGIVVMATRSRLVCTALQNHLESATLTVWVPAFLPNAPQQLDRVLLRMAQQVEASGATANEVDDLTTRLRDRSAEWVGIVESATGQLRQMGATAENFQTATEEFKEGVKLFKEGQKEFRQALTDFSTESAELRSQRSAVDEAVKQSLVATKHVLETSEAQATRIVKDLAEPLKTMLSKRLTDLNTTSQDQGDLLRTALQTLGSPLSKAAKELDNVLHAVQKQYTDSVTKLEKKFAHSNALIADAFREQNKVIGTQNTNTVANTFTRVLNLEELIGQRQVLTELLEKTNQLVGQQTSKLTKLLGSVEELSKQLQRVTVVGPWRTLTKTLRTLGGGRNKSDDK